jgi:6-phospho-beta-glucosidase
MSALNSKSPKTVVVNVRNRGAVADLPEDDTVEVPSVIDLNGPRPLATGSLPESVKGLVQAVKAYERLAIRAAVEQSFDLARLALMTYPIVGEWQPATAILEALVEADREYLGYLRPATASVV